MHGPERWGLDVFALENLQTVEQDVHSARPEEGHLLKVEGELIQGVTRPRNDLPRNIWDRQRQGGTLSDGVTRAWWIIHDSFIPGRPGVRLFDLIFVRQADADTIGDRRRSYNQWRESVKGEWLRYLRSGYRRFVTLMRRNNNAPPRWPSGRRPEYPQARLASRSRPPLRRSGASAHSRADLRRRRYDDPWLIHSLSDIDREVPADLLRSVLDDLSEGYSVHYPLTHDDLITHAEEASLYIEGADPYDEERTPIGEEAPYDEEGLIYIEGEADPYAEEASLVDGEAGYDETNLPFFERLNLYGEEPTNSPGVASDFFADHQIPIRARVVAPNNDLGDDPIRIRVVNRTNDAGDSAAYLEGHEAVELVYQLADRVQDLNNGAISGHEISEVVDQVTGGRIIIDNTFSRDTTPE